MKIIPNSKNLLDAFIWNALHSVRDGFYCVINSRDAKLPPLVSMLQGAGWQGISLSATQSAGLHRKNSPQGDVKLAFADDAAIVNPSPRPPTADPSDPDNTLATIFAAQVPGAIHLLRISAPGLHAAILAGADFRAHRPWLIVVAQTGDEPAIPGDEIWDHDLLRSAYQLVRLDGSARIYVAREHLARLAPAFEASPMGGGGTEAALTERVTRTEAWLRRAEAQGLRTVTKLRLEQQRRLDAEARLVVPRRSISWRITALLRAAVHLWRGNFGAALAEIHPPRGRMLRLRAVAGTGGGLAKRAGRVAFYVTARAAALLPGAAVAGRTLGRWLPTGWVRQDESRLLAPYPARTQLDLFDDAAVMDAVGDIADAAMAGAILPRVVPPEALVDRWSAAGFCIALLRQDPALRARFPQALSEGPDGAFAAWLLGEHAPALALPEAATKALAEVLQNPPSGRVRQVFLTRPDLMRAHPLGLTPGGRRGLLGWMFRFGAAEAALRAEAIWWFMLECAEDPARELRLTYLMTPEWQRIFPDAMTRFGHRRFTKWLSAMFGLDEAWADPMVWPQQLSASEQIRLAWHARPAWQRRFPTAPDRMSDAAGLLQWLGGAETGLPPALRDWCAALEPTDTAAAISAPGVNIIGHFGYPSGLRTSAETIVKGLRMAGHRVGQRDVRVSPDKDDPVHANFTDLESHETTLIHVQPEPFFAQAHELSGLYPRQPRSYRIGYWYWEMDTIPESWELPHLRLDELWTATNFVADALRTRFDQPVFTLSPGVELAPFRRRGRGHFGIPPGKLAFLFVFHMNSIMERKNPRGLIAAFALAFRRGDPVVLVLKTTFGADHPALLRELHAAAAEADGDIVIIDEVYSQEETMALMEACDAYVSLHRSEGLGLTMAESMLLGKPVIATRFSGNLDFMNDRNSLLVDADIVPIGRVIPPYEAHMRWAEPSVAHAAALMRQLFEDRAFATALGAAGKADLERNFSIEAGGRRMADRLEAIREERLLRGRLTPAAWTVLG